MNAGNASLARQSGATLVVALVMLVLMTLLAVSAINLSTGNLKVVGNMQYQQEAYSAAQVAISEVISRASHLKTPANAPRSVTVNVSGKDYVVTLPEPCLKASNTITVQQLAALPPWEALKCRSSNAVVNSGVMGQHAGGAPSDCARVTWEVRATVHDDGTNAHFELTEGVTMKMDAMVANAYKANITKVCR